MSSFCRRGRLRRRVATPHHDSSIRPKPPVARDHGRGQHPLRPEVVVLVLTADYLVHAIVVVEGTRRPTRSSRSSNSSPSRPPRPAASVARRRVGTPRRRPAAGRRRPLDRTVRPRRHPRVRAAGMVRHQRRRRMVPTRLPHRTTAMAGRDRVDLRCPLTGDQAPAVRCRRCSGVSRRPAARKRRTSSREPTSTAPARTMSSRYSSGMSYGRPGSRDAECPDGRSELVQLVVAKRPTPCGTSVGPATTTTDRRSVRPPVQPRTTPDSDGASLIPAPPRHTAPMTDEVELRTAWAAGHPGAAVGRMVRRAARSAPAAPRRYHGVRHVVWVLRHVRELEAAVPECAEPGYDAGAVAAAAFFHDAVYDATRERQRGTQRDRSPTTLTVARLATRATTPWHRTGPRHGGSHRRPRSLATSDADAPS